MLRRSLTLLLGTLIAGSASIALAKDIETDDVRITAAQQKTARATYVPWSGVWWPFADCELAKGWNGTAADFAYVSSSKTWERRNANKATNDLSPLLKYDLYVQKTTGTDPKSALMELTGEGRFQHDVYGDLKERYDREGISYGWWGHCNGWCAAALMEKEPIAPIEAQGIKFEVADLKGLLTETWWGCQSDFTGKRYNLPSQDVRTQREQGTQLLTKLNAGTPAPVGSYVAWYEKAYGTTMSAAAKAAAKPADFKARLENFERWFVDNYDAAYKDVAPNVFHKILETVIGRKKLAFVCDITANEEVWNHPAFAYETDVQFSRDLTENGVALKEWNVATTVWYATDGVSESILGVSEFTRDYTYTLVTDAQGKILRGDWTGGSVDDHPDFCWLPISNPTGLDTGENPKLLYGKVLEIMPRTHATSEARLFDLTAAGTRSSAQRGEHAATTWELPVAVPQNQDVALAVALLTSNSPVAKVKFFEEPVSANWSDVTASRSALVALGESSTAPAFSVNARFTQSGKTMLVAYAYDATGRLVAFDEITVNVGASNNGGGSNLADDAFEPNDSRGSATTVPLGATPNLVCKNDDWFKVTLAAAQDLEVKIAFKHSEGDLDLEVVNSSGTEVASSAGTSDEELAKAKALPAGTYYVHVFGYQGARARYALTVTAAGAGPAPSDDGYEENDDRNSAKALAAGTFANLKCNDDDWFKVTVTATGKLDAKIEFRHAEGDLDFELVNAAGTQVAKSDSTSDREAVSKTGLAAGTYYLHVYGYRQAKAAYSLTVTAP